MNKKGVLKILEASIAVLIIFGVVLSFVMIRKNEGGQDLSKIINPLLEEIAKNNDLREEIITNRPGANTSIMNFLASRIKAPNIGYGAKICEINDVCAQDYPQNLTGSLYAGSRIISSSLFAGTIEAKSKRISIFLWVKG